MATFAGKSLTSLKGINLRIDSNLQPGVIRWDLPTNDVSSVTGEYLLYVNSSGALIYDNGSSQTTIGAAGSSVTATWEAIYNSDNTFNIAQGAGLTIAGANVSDLTADVVTFTASAGTSGDVIQITNSGSGSDIKGTSGTWSVSKAGAAVFVGVTPGGDITSTATAIDWNLADNNSSALSFDASGATGLLNFDTSNGAEVVTFGKSMQVTDGNATFISTSNTVTNVLVTNNTITTFGADANSAGAVCIRSTSLTTGSLLQLQLSDTANAGGFYLNCRESVGGSNDFTIGENGVVAMAGTAGSASLTISAGDVVVSDGSLTMTDADNAASFSLTNNTATSASVVVIAGSGVFTGSTTSSFMTITPSGLTTGTAVYLVAAGLTQGKGLNIVTNALTSGQSVAITSSATAITTTGRMFLSSHSGTTGTSATLNEFISAATDETVILQAKASAALALGKVVSVSGAAVTTGTLLDISDNTAHTTGTAVNVVTNSSDTGTRSLVYIKQDHASASGATPLELANDGAKPLLKGTAAATSTHFYPFAVVNGVTLWMGDGTTANSALSGTAGDVLLNGGSNKPEYCTGTTNWTALV